MAAFTYDSPKIRSEYGSLTFWAAIRAGWDAYRQVSRLRSELHELAMLSPRLIQDVGFDPEKIYGTMNGTWDELLPNIQDYRLVAS